MTALPGTIVEYLATHRCGDTAPFLNPGVRTVQAHPTDLWETVACFDGVESFDQLARFNITSGARNGAVGYIVPFESDEHLLVLLPDRYKNGWTLAHLRGLVWEITRLAVADPDLVVL